MAREKQKEISPVKKKRISKSSILLAEKFPDAFVPPQEKAKPKPPENPMHKYIRENLRLEVERGNFTDPNTRTIKLVLCDEQISSVSIDVVQRREYEG